jgi:hypothetical protein
MATPWVGFTKPLLLASPTSIDLGHPDHLTSAEYAADYAEVKALGALDSTTRTPAGTENALFWNFSVPVLFNVAVRDWIARQDLGARTTARWFALLNMTVTDTYITCWRAKYDQPFWRPITAIREADTDGNPATTVDPAWTPLIDTPPYPDWPSGHGCLTSAIPARAVASERIPRARPDHHQPGDGAQPALHQCRCAGGGCVHQPHPAGDPLPPCDGGRLPRRTPRLRPRCRNLPAPVRRRPLTRPVPPRPR